MPTKNVFEYPSGGLVAENNQKRVIGYIAVKNDKHILHIRYVSDARV